MIFERFREYKPGGGQNFCTQRDTLKFKFFRCSKYQKSARKTRAFRRCQQYALIGQVIPPLEVVVPDSASLGQLPAVAGLLDRLEYQQTSKDRDTILNQNIQDGTRNWRTDGIYTED